MLHNSEEDKVNVVTVGFQWLINYYLLNSYAHVNSAIGYSFVVSLDVLNYYFKCLLNYSVTIANYN